MSSAAYDAVVIGAGHNGLCLAAYLARAGLRTAIVERRHEEGGGVNTEEPLLPGFRFNLHGQYMEFFDVMPMIRDFGLEELGLRTVMPEAQAAITFEDGRAVGVRVGEREIRAERCVASNADVRQTLLDLVGEEQLSPLWVRRARNFRYGPSHVLGTPMFCIREVPRYLSARWDEDVDRCFYTMVGFVLSVPASHYGEARRVGISLVVVVAVVLAIALLAFV